MSSEIENKLNKACQYRVTGDYKKALEIFNEEYSQHPDEFRDIHKRDFAWTLYNVSVQNFKNEDELFESAEFIVNLIPQKDTKNNKSDPYTSSVFKVLYHLNSNGDYYAMIYWLEKLNPEYLSLKKSGKGRFSKSRRETYYDYASKAYFECSEYEKCIEVSKLALDSIKNPANDGDVWHRWRMAKSLYSLKRFDESLEYLSEVVKVKPEWYIYKQIAEIYFMQNKRFEALKYLCPAILAREPDKIKLNAYYLGYRILNNVNDEYALKHAQYYYILKNEYDSPLPYDIKQLNINLDDLNKNELKRDLKDIWFQYKYQNKTPQTGRIIKFIEDKGFGFIKKDDGESIFFHKSEYFGSNLLVGQNVSFFTESTFDKAKQENSTKAVFIKDN